MQYSTGTLAAEDVIGQYRTTGLEDWPGLPYIEQHPWFALQKRNVLALSGMISPASVDDYLAHNGYKSLYKTVLNYTADKVCDIVEQSELRGRGGGGFPTGKKWKIALETGSDQKYLICNADESDLGAFQDRSVIESNPHQLIEGIAIASYAIGATHAYIYLRSDYEQPLRIIEQALQKAKECGFLGENIFGSGFNLNISIRLSAGAFVCGEETALIESLQGGGECHGQNLPTPLKPACSKNRPSSTMSKPCQTSRPSSNMDLHGSSRSEKVEAGEQKYFPFRAIP